MNTRTPKLLPWLARKAGISDVRAEALWLEAEHWAALHHANGSRYHQLCIERLLDLLAAESLREDAASFGWRPWARTQSRLLAASVQFAHDMNSLTERSWSLMGTLASDLAQRARHNRHQLT